MLTVRWYNLDFRRGQGAYTCLYICLSVCGMSYAHCLRVVTMCVCDYAYVPTSKNADKAVPPLSFYSHPPMPPSSFLLFSPSLAAFFSPISSAVFFFPLSFSLLHLPFHVFSSLYLSTAKHRAPSVACLLVMPPQA